MTVDLPTVEELRGHYRRAEAKYGTPVFDAWFDCWMELRAEHLRSRLARNARARND